MLLSETTIDGAAIYPIKGLHDAKPGDIISIGVEGQRHKHVTKIEKIVSNNRLQDREGNIFDRSGMIFRRSGWPLKGTTGKIVSAKHVTQKELDKEHDKDRRRYLKGYKWDNLDAERVEKVLKILRIDFGTMQKRIPYMESDNE